MFGGAVVALEPDDLGAGKVLFEPQDVFHFRAAPAIDRLVVVADAADVGAFAGGPLGEQPEPHVLRGVGVLVLVDQDESELLLVLLEHVRMARNMRIGMAKQIAEIDRVQGLQPLLVGLVERPALAIGKGAAVALGDVGGP
jgi:hypothetical protein